MLIDNNRMIACPLCYTLHKCDMQNEAYRNYMYCVNCDAPFVYFVEEHMTTDDAQPCNLKRPDSEWEMPVLPALALIVVSVGIVYAVFTGVRWWMLVRGWL